MSGVNYIVPPRGWDTIDEITLKLRKTLGLEGDPHFPIIDVLERVLDQQMKLLEFRVGDKDEMGFAEGLTCPSGEFIKLREDVYEGALDENGRDRFTACHELGHWHMHTKLPMLRAAPKERVLPAYNLSEPQANYYAASLLMPATFISPSDTALIVMARHGVSRPAAEFRLDGLKKRGLL